MATERRQSMNGKAKPPVKPAVAPRAHPPSKAPVAKTSAAKAAAKVAPQPAKLATAKVPAAKAPAATPAKTAAAAKPVKKAVAAGAAPEVVRTASPPQRPAAQKPQATVAAQQPSKAAESASPATSPAVQHVTVTKPAGSGSRTQIQAVSKPQAPQTAATLAPRVEITAPVADTVRPPRVRQPGDYVLEDQVGFQLRRAHQRATTIFNDLMTPFDVTPTQFAALVKIEDEGPISQNHLGRLTAMDPSTILGVVGRLVRQGLVQLRSTPGDARLTMIELTPDGQRKIGEMKTVAAQVTRKTLKALTPAEAKSLTELLARIG